ncbi:MAG: SPOR domain-containing protein [Proteobacteria bacterium]|nr:SPOR domain-containing protein [Pseudomonadota bacterium]
MAKLTARDYKSPQHRPLDAGRLREFAWGALAGVIVSGVAFAWYNNHARPAHDIAETPRPDPRRVAAVARDGESADADGSGKPQKYDFYEMLPNFEVVVPEKDKDVKRDLPAAARIDRPGVYVLQAGSYRNAADAERVRAQLKLQGVDAKVQRVAVDNDVWHRVRIGPIGNLAELNKVRRQLQAAEVDALVIRVGD